MNAFPDAVPVTPAELRALGPFQSLAEGQLELMAALARRRHLVPDQVLFEEGDPSDALFVIERGRVKARRRLQSGEARSIATLSRGDLVGEMGFIEGRPRSVQMVASEEARLLEFPSVGLLGIMSGDPQGARELMTIVVGAVAHRLRRANSQLLTLFQVGRVLGQADALDRVIAPVLELLLDGLSEAEGAMLWLVNSVSGELELHGLAHGRGQLDPLIALDNAMAQGRPTLPFGDALQQVLERTEDGLELRGPPSGSTLTAWVTGSPRILLAPLRPRATVLGALMLLDWSTEVSFEPTDADLLGAVAAQLAGAIERLHYQQEQENRVRLEQDFI